MNPSNSTDPILGPAAALPADEGLRCPACHYNLTGLAEERCPECGKPFDRETLRQSLAGKPLPVPGWDDGLSSWPVAFLRTCVLTWFCPSLFGRRFPLCYSRIHAFWFRVTALGGAVAIYALTSICLFHSRNRGGIELVEFLAIPPGVFVGALVCEFALAGIFSITMLRAEDVPSRIPPEGSVSWRGLVGYYRSFLLISASFITPVFVLAASWPSWQPVADLLWPAIIAALVWWWICLSMAAKAAAVPGSGWLIAVVSIPIVAVGSIFVGVVTSFLCGLACLEAG